MRLEKVFLSNTIHHPIFIVEGHIKETNYTWRYSWTFILHDDYVRYFEGDVKIQMPQNIDYKNPQELDILIDLLKARMAVFYIKNPFGMSLSIFKKIDRLVIKYDPQSVAKYVVQYVLLKMGL